jgi:homoserine trans-succinylase
MKTSQYQKEKERILKSKNSEIEKGNMLFGNWINYLYSSTEKSESQNIRYNSEETRIRVRI